MSKIHYLTYLGQEWGRGKLVEATCEKVRPYVDEITVAIHPRTPIFTQLLDELGVQVVYLENMSTGDQIRTLADTVPPEDFLYWHDSDERPTTASLEMLKDYRLSKRLEVFQCGKEMLVNGRENDWVPSGRNPFMRSAVFESVSKGEHTHVTAQKGSHRINEDRLGYYHFKTDSAFMQSVFLFFLSDPLNHATFDNHNHTGWNQECYQQWKPLQEKYNATLDVVGGWNMARIIPLDVGDLFAKWYKNTKVPGHMRLIAQYVFDLNMHASYPEEWCKKEFKV